MSYTLIMPCAGLSSRFPNMRPKYLLTTPDGNIALRKALLSVPQDQVSRIVVGINKIHEEKYGVSEALKRAIPEDIEIVVIDYQTNGPAETVKVMLENANVKGAFCVKDADSFFDVEPMPKESSFLSVIDLRDNQEVTRVAAKSFAILNEQKMVSHVVEKNVVSNYVSCGLYGFSSVDVFMDSYNAIFDANKDIEVFISHILTRCIEEGEAVHPHIVNNMIDVGTATEWRKYVEQHSIMFIDLDGVVFKNQSNLFPPYWDEEEEPLEKNVAFLLDKHKNGAQIIFATSRPEKYREKTLKKLESLGFKPHALIMGCQHGKRYVINDYSVKSNPYPTAVAINLLRNEDTIKEIFS